MCPVPESDGHDPPGLVCDFVPSLAAVIDYVVVVLEDAIGQVVVSHELPEIFDRVQLRRSWRQRQQGDVISRPWLCASRPDRGSAQRDGRAGSVC